MLRAGDILYIPRGWPHQARTAPAPHPEAHTRQSHATPGSPDPTDASAVGSAHLTLAVEVEPPFDWEGALHIALRLWSRAHRGEHLHPSADLLHPSLRPTLPAPEDPREPGSDPAETDPDPSGPIPDPIESGPEPQAADPADPKAKRQRSEGGGCGGGDAGEDDRVR